jgi:hypothetical protein
MEKTYKKIDEKTIEVTKTETLSPIINNYDLDFLASQRANIIKQANEFLAQRQTELDEVDELIAKCAELGIENKPLAMPSELK